jgi:hypothetical protein
VALPNSQAFNTDKQNRYLLKTALNFSASAFFFWMAPTPALLRIFISEKWANGKKSIQIVHIPFYSGKNKKQTKINCLIG